MDRLIMRPRLFTYCLVAGIPLLVAVPLLAQAPQPPGPAQLLTSTSLVGGKTLNDWMQDLKDRDPSVRETAMATLRLYGAVARPAIPALIKCTDDKDASLKVNAVIALGIIGMDLPDVPSGVAALTRMLRDPQAIVRFQAATALGRLGTEARSAIPSLVPILKDSQAWEIRRAAANALGSLGEDQMNGPDPRAVKGLADALNDVCYMVRLEAVLSLSVLGPPLNLAERQSVDRSLNSLLTSERNQVVQIWARFGVMRMEKPTDLHMNAIGKYLKSKDAQARGHAARALGAVGREAKNQVSDIAAALAVEEDPGAMFWMMSALGQIADPSQKAKDILTKLTQHKDETIRRTALEALQKIQQGPAPAPLPPKK